MLELTNSNFDTVVNGDKPVLVDFWAPWCGPCRMITPFIEQLAEEYEGRAVVAKVNVDEQSDIAARFQVSSIPTVMVFKDGKLMERGAGARPKKAFADLIERYL